MDDDMHGAIFDPDYMTKKYERIKSEHKAIQIFFLLGLYLIGLGALLAVILTYVTPFACRITNNSLPSCIPWSTNAQR